MNYLRNIWSPEIYHGEGRDDNFFEGWFYKLVNKDQTEIYSIIPGIFKSANAKEAHAFIQIVNGITNEVFYFRYNISEFNHDPKQYLVKIGRSYFNKDSLYLDINENDIRISGKLKFKNIVAWPKTLFSPGIMGWYSFVPYMECNHDVISMDHVIEGRIKFNEKEVDLENGKGYIEKDWGKKFPSSHIWLQSNHFDFPGSAFTCSIARIPWINGSFTGIISGLYHRDKFYKITTYTGARLKRLDLHDDNIKLSYEDERYQVEIEAERNSAAVLYGPYGDKMEKRLAESTNSKIEVMVYNKFYDAFVFKGSGKAAGMDVNGSMDELK